jgi:hypothetical protein
MRTACIHPWIIFLITLTFIRHQQLLDVVASVGQQNVPTLIKLLVASKADIHAKNDAALFSAIYYNRIEACNALVAAKANVNAVDAA